MFRKGKVVEKQNTPGKHRRLWGVLFLLLAAVFFVAYFAIIDSSITSLIARVELYLMGRGAILLPLFCLWVGCRALLGKPLLAVNLNTIMLVLFTLCLLGTAHNIFTPAGEELYPEHLPVGGGLLGGSLVLLLRRTIGQEFAWWLLLGGLIVSLLYILPLRAVGRSVRKLLFSKKKQPAQQAAVQETPAAQAPQWRPPVREATPRPSKHKRPATVYGSEEFQDYTEGIKPASPFKRILDLGRKKVYEDAATKQAIEENPVQLPEWEEQPEKPRFVRPYIDYGDTQAPRTAPDTVEEEPQAIPFSTQPVTPPDVSEAVPLPQEPERKPQAAKGTSVINNTYAPAKNATTSAGQPAAAGGSIIGGMEKCGAQAGQATPPVPAQPEVQPATPAAAPASSYVLPPLNLLDIPVVPNPAVYEKDIRHQCNILEQTLADFRVRAKVIAVTRGPAVTRFELEPAPGVKVSSVVNLADDIALKLAAPGVRIEAPIPGKAAIGIEAPNRKNDQVYFREVVDNTVVRGNASPLCIGLGKDISGTIIPASLDKMPHLLVAGSTGSGKSVCINTIIAGVLYKARPDEVKFILVDPKVVELSNYNGIPHLLTPVVTDAKKAASALHWAVGEMERRYQLFATGHVRDIKSYNQQAEEKLPFIVIIIDEMADLMMVAKVDVEEAILRLAQKARAAGIHLILATQRPSVDVITGIVKANIPSRIAFAVSSQTDSRTILDMGGAEKLLGKGDMLFYPIGANKPTRVQGAFVSDEELNRIVDFIKRQSIPVEYAEAVTEQALECDKKKDAAAEETNSLAPAEDELFEDAVRLVLDMGQASASMLQRRFRIGYTRAARLVDTMEELGIVGQAAGSKPREVILPRDEVEERFLNHD